MQVIMVTPSYDPIKGGAETVVRNLSVMLNKKGVNTDIMTFNMNQKWHPKWQAEKVKANGVNVFRIPALNWLPMRHSNRITFGVNLIPGRFRNQLREYDMLHFHGEDLTLPLFSYNIKKPKIFHSHGYSPDFYKRYFLSRFILKNIAHVYISVSRSMQKELVGFGILEEKIKYLPNGVDITTFRPLGKKNENLILFVGRITFNKGLHVLLESLHYLKKKIHLVIIGPSAWDIEYFRQMLRRINEENIKGMHKVTYLGEQEQTDILKWYQEASLVVSPSFREAASVVSLEALSCEAPMVATDVGGVPEIVRDGENGILVPPNNAVKLAEAIQYLMDNEDVRIKFGREGRRYVIKHYSYEQIVKRLCRIYEQMLS